ncbi:hypothetical protein [Falsiroseomonas tokyonensis]|nr:hypothetical protein [Falsiroseomonas tokyonensis]
MAAEQLIHWSKWARKLSKQLVDRIAQVSPIIKQLEIELSSEIYKASAYADERSDAWQDSDKAENYRGWIETMEEAVEALQTAVECLSEISAAPD